MKNMKKKISVLLSVFCFVLMGCSTNTGGSCVEWKTVEREKQECTRMPYRTCVIITRPEVICLKREVVA
jgi:outer membrane biogenesis lipoprotein LolB